MKPILLTGRNVLRLCAAAEQGKDVAIVDLENEFAAIFMHSMADLCTRDLDEVSSVDVAKFVGGPIFPY